jgi:hypothetical protein
MGRGPQHVFLQGIPRPERRAASGGRYTHPHLYRACGGVASELVHLLPGSPEGHRACEQDFHAPSLRADGGSRLLGPEPRGGHGGGQGLPQAGFLKALHPQGMD